MNHVVQPYWELWRLHEEIANAANAVRYLTANPIGRKAPSRRDAWADFESRLRDRATVLALTPEVEALEAETVPRGLGRLVAS